MWQRILSFFSVVPAIHIEGQPHSAQWFICVLIEYQGNNFYRVGLVRREDHEVEWITDMPWEFAIETLNDHRRRIMRSERKGT